MEEQFLNLSLTQKAPSGEAPAAMLLTRIISIPDKTKICLDLGYKSVAAENDLHHRLFFPGAPDLKILGQSEEHLVLEVSENHSLTVGDVLYAMPIHICPTCALFESATVVEDGMVTGGWEIIARNREIFF